MSSKGATADAPLPVWARAVGAVSRAFGVFSVGLILASIAVVCQMVFVRAVLGQSAVWQTEFSIFAMVAATFLGAPWILLTRGHVAVDVLPLMVGPGTRRGLFITGYGLALAFCLLFLWGAIPWWWEAYTHNQTTSSIWRARLWIPYLAVPVGLLLLCLQMTVALALVLTRRVHPFHLRPDERLSS